jgi:hypothetical protein
MPNDITNENVQTVRSWEKMDYDGISPVGTNETRQAVGIKDFSVR